MKPSCVATLGVALAMDAPTGALGGAEFFYEGMCDASAAVPLGANPFAVAETSATH